MLDAEVATLLPESSAVDERGVLVLGGVDVETLAARFGTPLYIYDEDAIRTACRSYMSAFVRGRLANHVHYASKAYLAPWLCHLLRDEGLGLDVVSGGELHVALSSGMPAATIRLHGNNKERNELADALDEGVGCIVVDNLDELRLVSEIARGRRAPIMLRLAPGVHAETHRYLQTSLLDGKFGLPLDEHDVPSLDLRAAVQAALALPGLDLRGYHAHVGSNLFDPTPVALAMRHLVAVSRRLYKDVSYWPHELCPGGGLGVATVRGEHAPSVETLAKAIFKEVAGLIPSPAVSVEPGRSIVGRAGVALYTVGACKDVQGVRRYVAVDGGMADNIRPALYDAAYTALPATKMTAPPTDLVEVAGRYCESGDILVHNADLPRLERGDLLALPAVGAYSLAMCSTYNGALRPAVVVVRDGEARLVQRRGMVSDLLAYEVVQE